MRHLGFLTVLAVSTIFFFPACSSGGGGNTDGGSCTPQPGQCSNICTPGASLEADLCSADLECGCGLACQPSGVPGDNACPNFSTEGKGVMLETCAGPNDCSCGLYCDKGLCAAYKGENTGCDCEGRQCLPITGAEEGCTCGAVTGCPPNKQIECACPAGAKGIQVCNAEGTGYGVCQCGGATDEGTTDEGTTDEGTTDEGTTDEGTTDEGSTTGEICKEKTTKKCKGSGFVWVDSCGEEEATVQPCPPGSTCKGDGCVDDEFCEPKVKKLCFEHNVFFYDSCNNKQGVTTICKDEEFCKGCTLENEGSGCETKPFCYKVDLSGDWLLKTKPGSSSACTSYPPQTLVLLIDGTAATGSIGVGTIQANFAGTFGKKKMKITANYQPLAGFDSIEVIEGVFLSPTTFDGTVYVEQSASGIPLCQAIFEITGDKK